HERLIRALDKLEPDVVIVCYGMNDGIYHPFSQARFDSYKAGIQKLIKRISERKIRLVLCTPPPFDPKPMAKTGKLLPLETDKQFAWFAIYDKYDEVILRYAQYTRESFPGVARNVDVYCAIQAALVSRRKTEPNYTMSPDGVHINAAGHLIMAQAIATALEIKWHTTDAELFAITERRTAGLHSAWLSEVGHLRPGTGRGKAIAEATQDALILEKEIRQLIQQKQTKSKRVGPLTPITDQPDLPRVLLIGDSISIGYTLPVRKNLEAVANVHRPNTNCGPTTKGVAGIDSWLGKSKWDVIHFNFGLHDLKWMGPNGENLAEPGKAGNHPQVALEEYVKNLEKIVIRLKRTNAVLIWRTTTPVPAGAKGRVVGDSKIYNDAALVIMQKHKILIDDMYGYSLPRLPQIQRKADVHFTAEGSQFLAAQVAKHIKQALEQRK
ncbi:MAG: SGNH/GDSL hydrolase family protein, partial [Planctomycetota bacterium]|nr:SGNH/GDSL hydrolase family protein [Planctomycetota bacterium]